VAPLLEPRTHLHKHIRPHSGALVLPSCRWMAALRWVEHWLRVFGEVNLLDPTSAQQQQALNRPLVGAPTALRQEGRRLKSFDQKHAVMASIHEYADMVCVCVCVCVVTGSVFSMCLCSYGFHARLFSTTFLLVTLIHSGSCPTQSPSFSGSPL